MCVYMHVFCRHGFRYGEKLQCGVIPAAAQADVNKTHVYGCSFLRGKVIFWVCVAVCLPPVRLCTTTVWKQTPGSTQPKGGVAHNRAAYWVSRARRFDGPDSPCGRTRCCLAYVCVCIYTDKRVCMCVLCFRAAISHWPVPLLRLLN